MRAKKTRRPGGERKKGIPNRMTTHTREQILKSGKITPLDFLLKVMRSAEPKRLPLESIVMYTVRYRLWSEQCLEVAKAAASYVHPRLAAVEHRENENGPVQHTLVVEYV